MPVFLPAKLRHLGCPAVPGRPSIKTVRKQHNNEVLPAPTLIQRKQTIRVTVCNVPIQLNGDVLVTYLSKYGSVEAVTPMKSFYGTAHGDYILTACVDREGFQAVPHIISYEQQQMMVVVEVRWPLCWVCKQLGHIARTCPQKMATIKTTRTTTSIITSTRGTTSIILTAALEPEIHPDNQEKGWILVTRKKKTSSPVTSPATKPTEETIAATTTEATTTETTTAPEITTDSTNIQPLSPPTKKKTPKRKEKRPSRGNSLRRWKP